MPAAKMEMNRTDEFHSCLVQVRSKILGKLPEDTKGPLSKLHMSLNGKVQWSRVRVQMVCSAETVLTNSWHLQCSSSCHEGWGQNSLLTLCKWEWVDFRSVTCNRWKADLTWCHWWSLGVCFQVESSNLLSSGERSKSWERICSLKWLMSFTFCSWFFSHVLMN